MGRLRKHVENPGLLQLVSPPDQFGTVTRQGRRVAGYIDHSLRTGCSNLPNGFEGAVTRRIEQHGIDTREWWDRQLGLCLLGALVQFGWEKALGDEDELSWWCAAARDGVRWL